MDRGPTRSTPFAGDVRGKSTGLGRNPLFQCAGIPNLVKMLLST